jgi:hypothetical protein
MAIYFLGVKIRLLSKDLRSKTKLMQMSLDNPKFMSTEGSKKLWLIMVKTKIYLLMKDKLLPKKLHPTERKFMNEAET